MTTSILYCGDTGLESAASYLAGLMTHFDWAFDYIPSDRKIVRSELESRRSLLILSDYPARQFDEDLQRLAIDQVQQGMGLLMIGGWESFHGLGATGTPRHWPGCCRSTSVHPMTGSTSTSPHCCIPRNGRPSYGICRGSNDRRPSAG